MEKNKPLSLLEKNVIAYHRKMLKDNTYGHNPETGDVTTFRGILMGVGKNKEDNATQLFPSWWNGRILNTQEEINSAMDEARLKGMKFPIYKNQQEAEQREKWIHDTYMTPDIKSGSYKKGIKIKE